MYAPNKLSIYIIFNIITFTDCHRSGDTTDDEELKPYDEPLYQNQEAHPALAFYKLDMSFDDSTII